MYKGEQVLYLIMAICREAMHAIAISGLQVETPDEFIAGPLTTHIPSASTADISPGYFGSRFRIPGTEK